MSCVKRKLVAFAVFAMIAFAPSASFAASTTCNCFCGEAGKGAMDMEGMSKEACKQTCDDTNTTYVGCFTDEAQYPVESDKCWTEEECEAWSDERNGVTVTADWGTVFPADCSKTKTSQKEMHYCYANDVPYDLNIDIGNVGEVENLPDYINLVYTWMLPAASLVAVVMMMIGGLQYTLSRGKPKYIEKAKTRITNAITGMVILLSAFVILNLIDPRLVSFDALKIPLIKEVVILDATSSCERLADYGYTITPTETLTDTEYKKCGGHGTISDISGLKENALGSWKEGDPCEYQYCDDGESCIADGDTNSCHSCSDIPEETASASTCAAIEEFEDETGQQIYCEYNAELRSCTSAGSHLGGSGAFAGFFCSGLRTDAAETVNNSEMLRGCDVYDELEFGYGGSVGDMMDTEAAALLQQICEEDKCNISEVWAEAGYEGVSCVYDSQLGCSIEYTGETE
jgi:Type IV secretion system pilin